MIHRPRQYPSAPRSTDSGSATYTYFIWVSVIGNVVGAFAALIAGLGDRWGRANMVVYGLLATGLLVTFGLPNASGKAMSMVVPMMQA